MSLHAPMFRQLRSLLLSGGLLLGVLLASSQAQVTTTITPDGTLGTTVTQSGTVHNITGGTRPGNGPNLFHSFDRFSVGTNDTASFSGPTGIVNILSRVTGGQQSVIDGQLQSTIPGANLYLLNPSGVLFRPNATLDIKGSFHVSTADVLRFVDGATFSARIGERSTLTTAPPAAFGFLGPTPAAITVQGSSLGVPEGKAVSVVGGEIQIVGGQLVAPGGRVQIASVASPGEVLASPVEMEPNLQVSAFTRLGPLTLSQNALLNVSGNSGGTVLIRGSRLLVDQSSIRADTLGNTNGARKGIDIAVTEDMTHTRGGFITAGSVSAGDAGNVQITARSLHVEDEALIGAGTFMEGRAGDIRLDVGTLTLTQGAVIDSSTFAGAKQGGTVTVTATDSITIAGQDSSGNPSGIFANALGNGEAGRVAVVTPTLAMHGGALQAASSNRGNAGKITLEVGQLTLTGGAELSSFSSGTGHGGTITVTAKEVVSLAENAKIDVHGSGGGTVVIQGGTVLVDHASISADTVGNVDGAGVGIDIMLAGALRMTQGGVISTTSTGAGKAGNIRLTAESVHMAGATIAAEACDQGRAGDIALHVGTLTLTPGARISSTTAGTGQGGDVAVTATQGILLAGTNNFDNRADLVGLQAGTFGQGNAGRVIINSPILTIQGFASIDASTFDKGNAGTAEVTADRVVLADGGSIFSNTRGEGQGGTVTIIAHESLSIQNEGKLSIGAFDTGDAGRVSIMTPSLVMQGGLIETKAQGTKGNAGTIVVNADRINLTQDAAIDSSTQGIGRGGSISIRGGSLVMDHAFITALTQGDAAGGSIDIHLTDTLDMRNAGAILAATFGHGNAGGVAIATPTLSLQGSALINASTFNEGNAGAVEITADRILLTEGGIISNTRGSGQAGTVTITARESLSLQNGGRLSTSAFDRGDAGSVSIVTPNLTLTQDATIASSTEGAGRGGSISIRGGNLSLDRALINASTLGAMAGGDGGNIDIHLTGTLDMRKAGGIVAATFGAGRGGDITVEVGKLTLTDGAEINGTTRGSGPGGNVTVTAHNSLSIFGRSSAPFSLSGLVANALEDASGSAGRIVVTTPTLQMDDGVIQAMTLGKGRAGEIQINVGKLTLTGGALISSSSGATSLATEALPSATGQGGNVVITATDFVTISGRGGDFPSSVLTETSGSRNAGHITLSTPILTMEDGRIASATAGDGRAGDVMLHVGRLRLAGGAQIASASGSEAGAVGSGQGGGVTITADDTIAISGRGSIISSSTFGSGDAGTISLTASTLRMDNEGIIQAGGAGGRAGDIRIGAANIILTGGAAINTSTTGAGQGGNVIVTAADLLSISGQDADGVGSGIASGTLGSGVGGNIVLQAQRLELNNGGLISVLSLGAGDAGNIVLQAGKTFQSRHGIVSAEAKQADGGNIQLTVGSRVVLRNSQITATVGTGVGKGGNITIDPQFVVMQGSQVRADAFGGPGGNVRIVAGVFLADPPSQVSASSALNIPGTVDIQAPVTNISGAIAPLPQEFASTAELLRDRCAGRLREGRMSRLVLGGRDGVPSEPGSLLLSPLIQMGSRENEEQAGIPAKPGQVQERAWPVQAGALEGLDIECARWTGHRGTTVKSKTYP
jgi:filamentous hemagglutinin family protein